MPVHPHLIASKTSVNSGADPGSPLPDAPRDRRSADRRAVLLDRVLARLPEIDSIVAWRACRAAKGPGGEDRLARRRRQALESASACALALGELPSYNRYEQWFRDHGKAAGHRSPAAVRSAFGAWAGVVEALADRPEMSLHGIRLRATGSPFTDEELRAVVLAVANHLNQHYLSFNLDYLPLARAQVKLEAAAPLAPRLPLSRKPFERAGRPGWHGFLIACGLDGARPAEGSRAAEDRTPVNAPHPGTMGWLPRAQTSRNTLTTRGALVSSLTRT